MEQASHAAAQPLLERVLEAYGFTEPFAGQKQYIGEVQENWMKFVIGVTLQDGRHLIVKLFHEDADPARERVKIENQSKFSELLRASGIRTPKRYKSGEAYTTEWRCCGMPCIGTVEDWCGEEITEITPELAYQIGVLMARMHQIALAHPFTIGCGTLFSAAYDNDVDPYPEFCRLCNHGQLNQDLVRRIKELRDAKLTQLRAVWGTLPKAATQGDISINNLALHADGLTVFDYNNAGDEVLVSDLVMEGLLTAYEMDLPDGTPAADRQLLFPALLRGYLTVRTLSQAECSAAWDIYTLYNSLWFSKLTSQAAHGGESLEDLILAEKFDCANAMLAQMLAGLTEQDDGRFRQPVQPRGDAHAWAVPHTVISR